jgi:hypothetical protein
MTSNEVIVTFVNNSAHQWTPGTRYSNKLLSFTFTLEKKNREVFTLFNAESIRMCRFYQEGTKRDS